MKDKQGQERLRQLPSMERLLQAGSRIWGKLYARPLLKQVFQSLLIEWRERLQQGEEAPVKLEEFLLQEAHCCLEKRKQTGKKKVLNATGIPLHTNLGRAPLSKRARQAVQEVIAGYSNLEYDLATGARGSRESVAVQMLTELSQAEASLAVNNNAAAVFLTLQTLFAGKEVLISRGELVEIGGSFRIPDIMQQSGVRLVEVGTTNKTYLRDYEQAITDQTAGILKVHTSNYRIVGFTAQPEGKELVKLGRERGLAVIFDLGSGTLLPLSAGGHCEPTVQVAVQDGFDLVTFSGDKLLGGGQAGLIVGRRHYVDRLRYHPLYRALRLDKLSLAALEGTLMDYLMGEAYLTVPVQAMLNQSMEVLTRKAQKLQKALEPLQNKGWQVKMEDEESVAGGGSLPEWKLPSRGVSLRKLNGGIQELEQALRRQELPVIGKIRDDALHLDVRTLTGTEIGLAARSIFAALREEDR